MRTDRSGISLVEALVALGLLAGLVISVSGVLVLGGRQIRGGADSSRALAAARTILEDLELRSHDALLRELGCDGALPSCSASSSALWPAAWDGADWTGLAQHSTGVSLAALDAGPISSAQALRLIVRVSWEQSGRARTLRLLTLRV